MGPALASHGKLPEHPERWLKRAGRREPLQSQGLWKFVMILRGKNRGRKCWKIGLLLKHLQLLWCEKNLKAERRELNAARGPEHGVDSFWPCPCCPKVFCNIPASHGV